MIAGWISASSTADIQGVGRRRNLRKKMAVNRMQHARIHPRVLTLPSSLCYIVPKPFLESIIRYLARSLRSLSTIATQRSRIASIATNRAICQHSSRCQIRCHLGQKTRVERIVTHTNDAKIRSEDHIQKAICKIGKWPNATWFLCSSKSRRAGCVHLKRRRCTVQVTAAVELSWFPLVHVLWGLRR